MSHDTWIHRIVRQGVRPLVNTPVTPNHLTALRLAFGLGAAAAFAAGPGDGSGIWGPATGAGLFVVSMALDRADGELARMSGKTSPLGHKFDLVTDALCNSLAFVGLGLGLAPDALNGWGPPLGLLAGLAVAAVLMLVILLEAQAGERAGEVQGAAGFDPDDAMLAIPVGVWLGLSDWLVLAASVGAPLFAVGMYVAFLFGRKRG